MMTVVMIMRMMLIMMHDDHLRPHVPYDISIRMYLLMMHDESLRHAVPCDISMKMKMMKDAT